MCRHLATALLVLCLGLVGRAAGQASLEYEVKAAFLLNFTRFVQWPGPPDRDPFRVCVFRSNPFGDALPATFEGETSQNRRVTPVHVTSPADARACHAVFVPRTESHLAEELLQALRGHAVLTVGESSNFLRQGGVVNFVVERERVRFDINAAAADAANLRVSSKLLRLARQVVPAERGAR
jgi:hypothetical protein